jgi:predicted nucleotidyltransferase
MAKTALDLRPHERQAYKPDKMFKLRTIEDERKIKTRYQAGWVLARKAATLLKREFSAEKVFVFGSLLHESSFTLWSDIDLSALGIAVDKYYAAVAAVSDLSSSARIDLVDLESCRPSLRDTIYKEGVEL